MKKLLLTSAAFTNQKIQNAFLSLIEKPINSLKIIFIASPARNKETRSYLQAAQNELLEMGIPAENFSVQYLDSPASTASFETADIVYVCGGNTFYILQQIRLFGFDQALQKFVNSGKIYIGVSAGSIIAGPSIEIAGIGETGDSNEVTLTDLNGLNMVPFAVSPHYTEIDEKALDQLEKSIDYQVIRLTDNQAVLVTETDISLIGEP